MDIKFHPFPALTITVVLWFEVKYVHNQHNKLKSNVTTITDG
jgi:hypothetical protein